MVPAEDALTNVPRDDHHEVVIAKSKKVIALTKGVAAVVFVTLVGLGILSVFAILDNQEAAADRILDCTQPYGKCYQAKIADNQLRNAVELLSVVEYCGNKYPTDVDAMKVCINKEVVRR